MLLTIKISVTTAPSHVSKPDWKLHSDPFLWNGKIYAKKKKNSQKALTHVLDQPPDRPEGCGTSACPGLMLLAGRSEHATQGPG